MNQKSAKAGINDFYPFITWAIPAPISPLPMTVTFLMALWLEEVLKNAEIAAKFFPNDGCLRIWADGNFEAVQRKREAIFWEEMPQVTKSVRVWNVEGRSNKGLGTKGQRPLCSTIDWPLAFALHFTVSREKNSVQTVNRIYRINIAENFIHTRPNTWQNARVRVFYRRSDRSKFPLKIYEWKKN